MAKKKTATKRKVAPKNYDESIADYGPDVYSNIRIYWSAQAQDWYAVARYYDGNQVEFDLQADPGETVASVRKRAAEFSGQKAKEIRVLKRAPR